jgi:3-isopropylmalate/(R)-2-methylmalate dehydratase small subunit
MTAIRCISGRAVPLLRDDIDTDALFPARFYTLPVSYDRALFADWRRRPDGSPDPDFPLEAPRWKGATILIAGRNFGCGSSREHAVWALQDAGFRAVLADGFGEIFAANAAARGLICASVERAILLRLAALAGVAAGTATVKVDLEQCALYCDGSEIAPFEMDAAARVAAMAGEDALSRALATAVQARDWMEAEAARRPWLAAPARPMPDVMIDAGKRTAK